jgi:hypothetical protein
VRLLRADEDVFALVEERCEPGNELFFLALTRTAQFSPYEFL